MLRAGVIGCGRIGSEFDEDQKRDYIATHSTTYVKNPDITLVAVCDIDKSKAIKCARRCVVDNIYTDYKEMLKKEKLDIVSICTPMDSHPEIVEYASKYVKGIYCEKPIAPTLKQARKMISVCKKNKVILQVNHEKRFNLLHKAVKIFVDDKIGNIKQVTFYYNRGIYNTGSHMFDLLNWFFGDADSVNVCASYKQTVGEENLSGVIEYGNIICNIIYCDIDYSLFEMDVIGTKGRIQLINGGESVIYHKIVQSLKHSENMELHEYELSPYLEADLYKYEMTNGVKHLISCIKNNTESASSGEDGYKSLLLITAFLDSAISKEKIYLEEYNE